MARMSQLFTDENFIAIIRAGAEICSFCGEETRRGGFWSGAKEVTVCTECVEQLIHLLWDTIADTGNPYRKKELHDIVGQWRETIEKCFWYKAYLWSYHQQSREKKDTTREAAK